MTALVTFLGWNLLAVAMSFAAQALFSNDSPEISIAPAPVYFFVVVFVSLLIVIPTLIIFRDRKRHLIGQLVAFIGVFGLLLPNLVVALQRAQI